MIDDVWLRVKFHPVGQGLFVSGALGLRRPDRHLFRWIYDCGTSSSQDLIRKEIGRLPWPGGPFHEQDQGIELATISHFDRDHISGFETLLQQRRIDVLLLPYAPLWSRIGAAFEQGIAAESSAFGAFLDPIGHIRSLDGEVGQIVVVGPSGDERPPDPQGDEGGPESPLAEAEPEGARPRLSFDARELSEEQAAELGLTGGKISALDVASLVPGGRLLVDDYWEFVPYNDADSKPRAFRTFIDEVAKRREELLATAAEVREGRASPSSTGAALESLKRVYDVMVGSSAKKRNLISLFLYSGPKTLRALDRAWTDSNVSIDRVNLLLTGDGYVDCEARCDALVNFLGTQRMSDLGVLQVMHHGARANWYPGLGKRLAPQVSVFSSDPDHAGLGHPHSEVLRDFWSHGAVQVDKQRAFVLERWP